MMFGSLYAFSSPVGLGLDSLCLGLVLEFTNYIPGKLLTKLYN